MNTAKTIFVFIIVPALLTGCAAQETRSEGAQTANQAAQSSTKRMLFDGDLRPLTKTTTLPAKQHTDSAGKVSGISGWVDLEVWVNPDGTVYSVKPIAAQPPGIFEAQAVAEVKGWKYQQKFLDGVAVEQRGTQRISFGQNKVK